MTLNSNHVATRSIEGAGIGGEAPVVGAPWFVQFWPVFIAAMMVVSIAASLVSVALAYRHADVDVRPGERSAHAAAAAREAAESSRGVKLGGVDDPPR